MDLPIELHYPSGDSTKPVAVMTWYGTDINLPSILLNSHMDVVPVFEQYWTHPPFAADIDDSGNIYARGAQDMKSVGMQYLGAIKVLKDQAVRLKRTVHIIYMPGNFGFLLVFCLVPSKLRQGYLKEATWDPAFHLIYG